MKDYVTLDLDDDDADFRYGSRDTMIAQFKQDLYKKSFRHQDQSKREDGLQRRIKFWLNMLLVRQVQNQKMFAIMIIVMKEYNISFEGQSKIASLKNYKNS